jgi:nucleotide-binding universal stress UspA family protein
MKTYSHILVPIDLGDQAKRVLDHARSIADRFGSRIDLLYCFPNPQFPDASGLLNPLSPEVIDDARNDAEQQLQEMITARDRDHFKAVARVIVTDPLDGIVDYAKRERIDLIVMGTHGRTGLTHMFLGSVAERVVRTAPCDVLTVH